MSQRPRTYIHVLEKAIFYFIWLLTVFICGCLEESRKEQKVRLPDNFHCGHKISPTLLICVIGKSNLVSQSWPGLMNDEVALAEIFCVKDPQLCEESLLDSEENVSEYSANSSESEDEIETTKESESLDESTSDVSEDVAVGDGNRRGQIFVVEILLELLMVLVEELMAVKEVFLALMVLHAAKFVHVLILHSKQLLKHSGFLFTVSQIFQPSLVLGESKPNCQTILLQVTF